MLPPPTEVLAAAHRLRGIVTRTPLVPCSALGANVHLKCENLQRTGSFKLRGAYNVLATLPDHVRSRGVVAASAGNHGLGIAYAAHALGVPARVFVPSTAPRVKQDGIAALGAVVDASQPHYDAAHALAEAWGEEHGMTFVSPCSGDALLSGQGTVALEVLEDNPGVTTIVVPVGGGGLVGGIAAIVRAVSPGVRIIGVQSELTNAMAASLEVGERVEISTPATLADGLAGQIDEIGLAIGRVALDDMVVVTEAEIARAIAWLFHQHQLRVEGSGAVGVAAILAGAASAAESTVVIVSGGNIDEVRWRAIVGEDDAR